MTQDARDHLDERCLSNVRAGFSHGYFLLVTTSNLPVLVHDLVCYVSDARVHTMVLIQIDAVYRLLSCSEKISVMLVNNLLVMRHNLLV